MQRLTRDQLHALPAVVDLVTAARALGIARTKAYRLTQTGQFPCRVLRVGRSYHVPTAGFLELLGITHLREHIPSHERDSNTQAVTVKQCPSSFTDTAPLPTGRRKHHPN